MTNRSFQSASSLLVGSLLCALLGGCFSSSDDSTTPTGTNNNNTSADGGGGGGGGGGTGDGGGGGGGGGGGTTLNTELIDDMEANTGSIIASKGRVGAWYVYNDATAGGTQEPGAPFEQASITPPRGASGYGSRTHGSGFTTWGAGMGFNFNDPGDGAGGSMKALYDASAYKGIVFYAKAAASTVASIRVNISGKDTDPSGGVCAPAAKCSDDFGKSITLTQDWAQYALNFSDLAQQGFGTPVTAFDASKVYAVHFQVAKGSTFDFWIDDISFILK